MPRVSNTSTKVWDLKSDKKVWTSTYWPMANLGRKKAGNPKENLWADGGCLDKFDGVLKARGDKIGAKTFEKTPALNYLKDPSLPTGYYVARKTVKEKNAEMSTGVDFNGSGSLNRGVKVDFIDDFGGFGTNGTTTGKMDVSWWGSCDMVALAGLIFEEPKRAVTIEGVTFTPLDIKGLLTVIADSQAGSEQFVGFRYDGQPDQVELKDGRVLSGEILGMKIENFRTGEFSRQGDLVIKTDVAKAVKIKTADGKVHAFAASKVEAVAREDQRSLSPAVFHKTTKAWLRQKRPFAMDHDPGPHVWNDNFDHARIVKTREVPEGVKVDELNGHEGPYTGGKLAFYETDLTNGTGDVKNYGYWIEKKDGEIVNSGWIINDEYDENPDFMWRPSRKPDPKFKGTNDRNPFVLPALVKEIYEKSI